MSDDLPGDDVRPTLRTRLRKLLPWAAGLLASDTWAGQFASKNSSLPPAGGKLGLTFHGRSAARAADAEAQRK